MSDTTWSVPGVPVPPGDTQTCDGLLAANKLTLSTELVGHEVKRCSFNPTAQSICHVLEQDTLSAMPRLTTRLPDFS